MTITQRAVSRVSTLREARGSVPGDGIRLAWGCWPGAGPPVVGLHGVTASYVNFVGIADELTGRRPLLAFDLRGRGDSDKPDGPYGMSQHARDVAAAMTHFGLDASIVVGHSMGAYVAVALAAEHPGLVRGLVLVDGGLPLPVPPGIAPEELLETALSAQMARLRMTFPSEAAYLDYWRSLPVFAGGRWNDRVERYLRYDLGGRAPLLRPKASAAAVRADAVDNADADRLRARLRSLTVPVLLLRAEEGFEPGQPPLFPAELVDRERGQLADLTDRVVAGTTHYTIALGPQGAAVVADAVAEFAEACGR
ncbi:MAG TPA: alpha/beta hydrolase [Mycobacteriales bacterium]|nr:alpha/beta hydrolase [Mycobacteriales bacterium]